MKNIIILIIIFFIYGCQKESPDKSLEQMIIDAESIFQRELDILENLQMEGEQLHESIIYTQNGFKRGIEILQSRPTFDVPVLLEAKFMYRQDIYLLIAFDKSIRIIRYAQLIIICLIFCSFSCGNHLQYK